MIKTVVIESPYQGAVERNVQYARECMIDCLNRGESPFASHLLYTQVLDDLKPEQRTQGINAGLRWAEIADLRVFYVDLGFSDDMLRAMEKYQLENLPYEIRQLSGAFEIPSGMGNVDMLEPSGKILNAAMKQKIEFHDVETGKTKTILDQLKIDKRELEEKQSMFVVEGLCTLEPKDN